MDALADRPGAGPGSTSPGGASTEDLRADEREGHAGDGDAFGLYDDETLAAIDGWEPSTGSPARASMAGWRRRSATGAVLGAALLGLGDALEGRRRREQPPIVSEDPGQPHDPDALVEVHLDPTSPAASVAVVRHRPGRGGPGAGTTPALG
jgi:hypothetical protein